MTLYRKRKRELLYEKSNFMLSFYFKILRIRKRKRYGSLRKRLEIENIHNKLNFWTCAQHSTINERAKMIMYSTLLSVYSDVTFAERTVRLNKKFDVIVDCWKPFLLGSFLR